MRGMIGYEWDVSFREGKIPRRMLASERDVSFQER